MVGTDSCRVPLTPHYLGSHRPTSNFAYVAFTLCGRSFQNVQLAFGLDLLVVPLPRKDKSPRFGLFRFRSPLLTESLSFSFPGVTEMFHFTPSCFSGLSIHPEMTAHYYCRIAPFGNLRIGTRLQLPAAFRSLPRPSSPPGS